VAVAADERAAEHRELDRAAQERDGGEVARAQVAAREREERLEMPRRERDEPGDRS